MAGGAHISGTISRAFTSQDGVTNVQVSVGRDNFFGPLTVRGEPLDNLPGCQVRSSDGGRLWTLTKGRAEG
jgi:hypothetical protein